MGFMSGMVDVMNSGAAGEAYGGIQVPDIELMKLTLEEYVSQGILEPEDVQTILQDPSAMEAIVSDPRFKEAQTKALVGLQDVAEEGGMTSKMRARLGDIGREEGARERGSREAILANAAAKGTSGSGLEFMSQLKNQSDSADRASQRGTQVAADAEDRALQALIDSGTMAGNIRTQDFSEQSAIAKAKDEVNRFNTMNRNSDNRWNVGNRNAAAASNLAAKQGIADMNVGQRNTGQAHNKGLYQNRFDNNLRLAAGRSGAAVRDADRLSQGVGGMEKGVASLIGGAYGASQDALDRRDRRDGYDYQG